MAFGQLHAQGLNGTKSLERDPVRVDSLYLELDPLGVEQGLSAGMIHTMAQDTLGYLWLGTRHGLNRYDGYTIKVFKADGQEGIPDEVIYGILADEKQQLWLSTNQGLCRLDPHSGRVRSFSVKDGLQHQEFNRQAAVKDRNGHLFFGGVGGLTYFDPEAFYQHSAESHTVINGIRLFNQDLLPDSALDKSKTVVSKPIHALDHVQLHERDRMLTFSFAKLDFSNPTRNRYRYRLIGFQDEWIDLGQQREATFTNIPKGRYQLEVQSANRDGTWSTQTRSLELQVRPFWVVLMDINMPHVDGIEGLKALKATYPELKVVMQTIFEDEDKILEAISAGADGYILKQTSPMKLLDGVKEVMQGGAPMTPIVARKVLLLFSQQGKRPVGENISLTKREREILGLLVEGNSYKMIAERCHIAYSTVNKHISNIYEKLQVHSVAAAVSKAIQEGLV